MFTIWYLTLSGKTRWEYVMEYSRDIKALLGNPKSLASPLIDDPKTVLKVNLHIFMFGLFDCVLMGRDSTLELYIGNSI